MQWTMVLTFIPLLPVQSLCRVREELTHCSPEKKTEGMFAGFPKWSKGAAGATEGEARERSASWTSRGKARYTFVIRT